MELKPLRSADKRNMKVTFYLSDELYSAYKSLQKQAKEIGFRVDLTNDFSTWFSTQLEEAKTALEAKQKFKNR
jgi:hypothetical protein